MEAGPETLGVSTAMQASVRMELGRTQQEQNSDSPNLLSKQIYEEEPAKEDRKTRQGPRA